MIILILLIFGSGHCRYRNKEDKRETYRNAKKKKISQKGAWGVLKSQ